MSESTLHHDVFLSHNSADKPAVEVLAQRLLVAGIRPWLDSWNLIPGDPWEEAIEQALDACAICAVFLGPSGIGPWHNEEMRVVLDRRARDRMRSFRVIPVLLPGADPANSATLPRFLGRMTWVDFRGGLDDSEAFRRLVAGIRGVAPGPGSLLLDVATASSKLAIVFAPSASAFGQLPAQVAADSGRPTLTVLTPGERQRQESELARLQNQYGTWTRRIGALDIDVGRATDSVQRQILDERRSDLLKERDGVASVVRQIEDRLAGPDQQLRLTVHTATVPPDSRLYCFVNATNFSDRDIVVTHVWFDCRPQVHILQQARPLPVRLKPCEPWEIWIELAELPTEVQDDPYRLARARLSTGLVVESARNKDVPVEGFIPGGPFYSAHGN